MTEQPRRPLFAARRRSGDQPPLVRVDPHTLAYFTVILLMLGLAGWLYLHQASQVATYAHQIRRLEHDKERLHREMIALRAEVAETGSLETVLAHASVAGYTLPRVSENKRMLILEVPIELVGAEAAPESAMPAPSTQPTRPLGERLLEQLHAWLDAPPD